MLTIEQAKEMLDKIDCTDKHDTMLHTAAIITSMLEKHDIKPIIVGGFSVEIYTQLGFSEVTGRNWKFE